MTEGRIRLLLADVDGTLVDKDKALTERAKAAVASLKAAGIRFAITSGRPPKGMAMLIGPLALDTPIAGFNGGLFVRPDLSIITERTLPEDIAHEAVALIRSGGLTPWVYSGRDWLVQDPDGPHVEHESHTVQFGPKTVDALEPHLTHAVKIVGVSDDYARVERCETDAKAAFGDRATALRSQAYYLDVTHKDANKGAVAEYLSRELDIPLDAIATIGDQPNDVLMFRKTGLSIAMGNASDQVKAQASRVTDANDDEGFAKAVERLLA